MELLDHSTNMEESLWNQLNQTSFQQNDQIIQKLLSGKESVNLALALTLEFQRKKGKKEGWGQFGTLDGYLASRDIQLSKFQKFTKAARVWMTLRDLGAPSIPDKVYKLVEYPDPLSNPLLWNNQIPDPTRKRQKTGLFQRSLCSLTLSFTSIK
jgi:hypothetical protein